MITITIETDNAAFEEDENEEIARILRGIESEVYERGQYGLMNLKLKDINGNTVGEVQVT